jgi:hypothetical protein
MKVKFYTEELVSKEEIKTMVKSFYNLMINISDIQIIIVSSFDKTSFVDGVGEIYDLNNNLLHGFVVEITQTTDSDSRNSSAYQRLPKFVFAKQYYPNYDQFLYYRNYFTCSTPTCLIGLSIANILGVKIINCEFEPLSLETLLILKKKISEGKSHNIPLFVDLSENYVKMSGKLKNGNKWADSTVGFMSSMIFLLSRQGYKSFKIVNHHLSGQKLYNTNNKFRKIISLLGVTVSFEGTDVVWSQNDNKFQPSETYFKILEKGEKLSMINLVDFLSQNGHEVIFTNISGCERGKLVHKQISYTFPKSMRIPDIISIKNDKLFFIEGECTENLEAGLLQIKDFTPCVDYVCSLINSFFKNIYIGVITDLENKSTNQDYFGHYLNPKNYSLNNGIFC